MHKKRDSGRTPQPTPFRPQSPPFFPGQAFSLRELVAENRGVSIAARRIPMLRTSFFPRISLGFFLHASNPCEIAVSKYRPQKRQNPPQASGSVFFRTGRA